MFGAENILSGIVDIFRTAFNDYFDYTNDKSIIKEHHKCIHFPGYENDNIFIQYIEVSKSCYCNFGIM